MLNVLDLTKDLVSFPSITPAGQDIFDFLEHILKPMGFSVETVGFKDEKERTIYNMYARYGNAGRNLCFGGHVDVVPSGEEAIWSHPPFTPTVANGQLFGRGVADMKGAVAAFIVAVQEVLKEKKPDESISLLITGDEEGPGTHGTKAMVPWLAERGETLDACIIGEPTSFEKAGDAIKIGRRGSITFHLTVYGQQGHVAYPEKADNPLPKMLHILSKLNALKLDEGFDAFQPSKLEITTIDVGNKATNVIPSQATAMFNIRFNPKHTTDSLEQLINEVLIEENVHAELQVKSAFEPFVCQDAGFKEMVASSIKQCVGSHPDMNVLGGTSDGRFLHPVCPVVEVGLVNKTIHAIDENVAVSDLENLVQIYKKIIENFMSAEK